MLLDASRYGFLHDASRYRFLLDRTSRLTIRWDERRFLRAEGSSSCCWAQCVSRSTNNFIIVLYPSAVSPPTTNEDGNKSEDEDGADRDGDSHGDFSRLAESIGAD